MGRWDGLESGRRQTKLGDLPIAYRHRVSVAALRLSLGDSESDERLPDSEMGQGV